MKKLLYVLMLVLTVNLFGCKGEIGPEGPKGDSGVAGSPGAAGQQGTPGTPGATGPKGDTGNSNVISTTWTFDRSAVTKYVTSANVQIPTAFNKEPANFTGLFMAYLTPLETSFGGFSPEVTLVLPHQFSDGGASTSALAYRTVYKTYYIAFMLNSAASSPSNFGYLGDGKFSLRLVWVPASANGRIGNIPDASRGIQFINGEPVNQPN